MGLPTPSTFNDFDEAAAEAKRVGKAVCWRFDIPEAGEYLEHCGTLLHLRVVHFCC